MYKVQLARRRQLILTPLFSYDTKANTRFVIPSFWNKHECVGVVGCFKQHNRLDVKFLKRNKQARLQ